MQYEVTIGIPVYRAENYIRNTMKSALAQTFTSIEFLILDDCGGDGSMAIVEQMRKEHRRGGDIRVLCNPVNCGVGASRNRIMNEARGRYLFFLDSDDLLETDTIERMIRVARAYQAEVVYGSWERVDNVNYTPSRNYFYPFMELLKPNDLAIYAFENYSTFRISVCNCLFDLSFLRSAQLQFLDTVFWEDLAFTYEMVTKVQRAVLLPDITYHYLCRPGSLSHYQDRNLLRKDEILKNVSTISILKKKSKVLVDQPYISCLCYNLEMNSFYIVCHILKHYRRVVPRITYREMRQIVRHPLPLSNILYFKQKLLPNLLLWLLGVMPAFVSIPSVWLLGKLKRAI